MRWVVELARARVFVDAAGEASHPLAAASPAACTPLFTYVCIPSWRLPENRNFDQVSPAVREAADQPSVQAPFVLASYTTADFRERSVDPGVLPLILQSRSVGLAVSPA